MKVQLKDIGKRFNKEWVFKHVDFDVEEGSQLGIIGSNGSGKSTLIKLISGAEIPTSGQIVYSINEKEIDAEELYKELNYAAPYIDLPEELTLNELVEFHSKFKSLNNNLSKSDFLNLIYLTEYTNKYVKNFSSGMKQRLKLGLALCFQANIILLDEPCSNLDKKGVELYHDLLENFGKKSTIIIGSNEQSDELYKVHRTVNVLDFKP